MILWGFHTFQRKCIVNLEIKTNAVQEKNMDVQEATSFVGESALRKSIQVFP